ACTNGSMDHYLSRHPILSYIAFMVRVAQLRGDSRDVKKGRDSRWSVVSKSSSSTRPSKATGFPSPKKYGPIESIGGPSKPSGFPSKVRRFK
ncbi:hypothetical protein HAX54_022785, partial [Datura stramonium]|nr:hypothetical protein [Datura stramonium]